MRSTYAIAIITALTAANLAAAQTVTVHLDSTRDGQVVAPGATVDWQITFTVSTGDNQGLATLICDLSQDSENPGFVDLPPAAGVPSGMTNFSRPAGISNPGESGATTGYVGVQRGTAGSKNLRQIGGGQNTFGTATPAGTGIAESANVVGSVGQSGTVTLALGSFTAPSACGTYRLDLANVMANVVTQLNTPPAFSPVTAATIDVTDGSITFTVGLNGDLDGDGDVDLADLAHLLGHYGNTGMSYEDGDLDGDGDVDLADLATLLGNYGRTCG